VTIVDNFKSDNNIIENEGGKLFIETIECAQQTHRYCGCQQPKPENWKTSLQKQRMCYLHQQVAVISLQIT
jgi:hypothetical protein